MAFDLKVWSSGETVTHTDLNGNFSKFAAKFGSLVNSDLAENAAIASSKLLDRFAVSHHVITIGGQAPHDQALIGTSASGTLRAFPATTTEPTPSAGTPESDGFRWEPEIPASKRAYLCSVSITTTDYQAGTGGNSGAGYMWIFKNTTLLSGDGTTISASGTVYLQNSSPFSNPIIELQQDDYFELMLGHESGASGADFGTIQVCFTLKTELVS